MGTVLSEISVKEGTENLAAIYINNGETDEKMQISFRSNMKYEHRGLCEIIAKHFGGGGHKTAASCTIDR